MRIEFLAFSKVEIMPSDSWTALDRRTFSSERTRAVPPGEEFSALLDLTKLKRRTRVCVSVESVAMSSFRGRQVSANRVSNSPRPDPMATNAALSVFGAFAIF